MGYNPILSKAKMYVLSKISSKFSKCSFPLNSLLELNICCKKAFSQPQGKMGSVILYMCATYDVVRAGRCPRRISEHQKENKGKSSNRKEEGSVRADERTADGRK